MIWSKLCDAPYTNVAASSLCPALMASDTASPESPEHRFARAASHKEPRFALHISQINSHLELLACFEQSLCSSRNYYCSP